MSKDLKEDQTPDWLKSIQLNSWEAELLISALVLFALFQIPDLIREYALQNFDNGSLFHRFFRGIRDAVQLLKLGYALHILIRGLWVASVGLSYVFPKGIDRSRLKFKGRFEKELESKNSLVSNVLRLEELSSIIYGVTFLLFGSMLGFGLLLFIFIAVTELLAPSFADNPTAVLVYIVFFFFYFMVMVLMLIDFLTNGLFRRIDWMAAWFYPVAVLFRVLTLSFLYRRSLLVMISNTRGWKSNLIPFVVVSVCAAFYFINREIIDGKWEQHLSLAQEASILNENYENLRSPKDHLISTIQSDLVSDNALSLFTRDLGIYRTFYAEDSSKSKTDWVQLSSDSSSFFLNKWIQIRIDSINYKNLRWFKSQHATTLSFGFRAHLNLTDLASGSHNLVLKLDTTDVGIRSKRAIRTGDYQKLYLSNIHFFYDK